MKFSEFGVKNPVTTSMIFIAIVVLGAFAYTLVGIDLMPKFDVPVVMVVTQYQGAGPQEVEQRVTELIEARVSSVENVDEVTSTSMEGISLVNVKFKWGINMDTATNDIRDKIDQIRKRLPDAAETPLLMKIDMSMIPVVIYGVTAKESWNKIETITDDKVIDRLKRIPGVATVTGEGGAKRVIKVKLNRERLESTGITGSEIVNTIRAQNLTNPGGHIRSGEMDFLIRTPEEFTSVDQVGEVVLRHTQNGVIKVKDVAEVEDGLKELTEDFRMDGKQARGIMIQKQSGGNTVAVAKSVKDAEQSIKDSLPKDMELIEFLDTSTFIKNTVNNLKNSLLFGGVCVLLVILFFLRDFRASLIVAITIPTSLIITFLLMFLNDYTINQISLSSLVIAIGMVVDNAIVVIDNIKRYIERGVKVREAAAWGANEMTASVVASTLTTVVIFLPIMFTTGITKIFFGQLAAIVSMALLASLISGLLLTPMLASKILTPNSEIKTGVFALFERFLRSIENFYVSILKVLLNFRLTMVTIMLVLLVLSFTLVPLVGVEYMPNQDQGRFTVHVEMQTGTRYERTGDVCRQIRDIVLKKFKDEVIANVYSYGIGESAESVAFNSSKGSNKGQVQFRLRSRNVRTIHVGDVINAVRPDIEKIPGITVRFETTRSMGSGKDFTLNVYGHNLEKGVEFCNKLVEKFKTIEGLQDLEVSQKLASPELTVNINREKASSLGINVNTVANLVELYFSGNTTVKYREGGDEYDIEVRLRPEDREKIEDLNQITIPNKNGEPIRLSNIATVKQVLGPTNVKRYDQQRYIQITGSVYGTDAGSVIDAATAVLNSTVIPTGFAWEFSGDEKDRKESFLLLIEAGLLGIMLVYMVMASQFESLLAPFIIAFSIPFGFIGAIVMLIIAGSRLSVVSLLGGLILVGIVVNNGIVLISYVNILIARGYKTKEALVEAGRSRLRPVLSTTTTTILGMIPMAISTGDGAEMWIPIAWTVIGGLAVSTCMTMTMMPVVYSLLQRWLVPADQRDGYASNEEYAIKKA